MRFLQKLFQKNVRPAAKRRQANLQMEALEARDNPAPYLPGKTFLLANFDTNGVPVKQSHIYFSTETARPDLVAQQVGFEYVMNDNTQVYALTGMLEDPSNPVNSHVAFNGWLVDLGDGTNLVHLTASGSSSHREGLLGFNSYVSYTDDFNGAIDESGTNLNGSLYTTNHYEYWGLELARETGQFSFSSDYNNYYTSNGVYIGDGDYAHQPFGSSSADIPGGDYIVAQTGFDAPSLVNDPAAMPADPVTNPVITADPGSIVADPAVTPADPLTNPVITADPGPIADVVVPTSNDAVVGQDIVSTPAASQVIAPAVTITPQVVAQRIL
jgi:hypothetical protein